MHNALDIALFIINYSIDVNNPTDTLRLQKELFYVQKEFLIKYGQYCFKDYMYKWRQGAIIPDIHKRFMHFVKNDNFIINEKQNPDELIFLDSCFGVKVIKREFNDNFLQNDHKYLIIKTVENLKKYGSWELVDLNKKEKEVVNTKYKEVITFRRSLK